MIAGDGLTRRRFLAASAGVGGAVAVGLGAPEKRRRPDREEDWDDVRAEWPAGGTVLNLESGGVQVTPLRVEAAFQREWASAQVLPPVRLGREIAADFDVVRARLAAAVGCGVGELALVRNTTEGIQNLLQGWRLERGDRILTTTQDYWRFHDGIAQRAARDGIGIDTIRLAVPADQPAELVRRFTDAVTPRTRLVLLCHVVNLTGQILPVAAIAAALRSHGVRVLVDGAHGFGHVTGRVVDLGCDAYATSLHKWLGAPHGTGFLFLREDRIEEVWPLFPAPAARAADIRKFESVGTAPSAPFLAIPTALDFWAEIGPGEKLARLRWLRDRWVDVARTLPGARSLTRMADEGAGALATFHFAGRNARALASDLLERERILVRAIVHPEFDGIRVAPNLFNSAAEIDRFALALRRVLRS